MRRARQRALFLLGLLALLFLCSWGATAAKAQSPQQFQPQSSITDRSIEWPSADDWLRVLTLQDYNTRVVTIGAMLLGCAGGMVGSFTLLRKRALMGDALSHATLPGICLAFMIATAMGVQDKSLPILLLGATCTGVLGVGSILLIRNLTRLKEDTALGAVLSVFFGAGIALLSVVQQMKAGHAAGLESFIYGKTASMVAQDTILIGVTALVAIICCLLLYRRFKVLCFDENFAASQGTRIVLLDLALMALVVAVCIVGLQAVGLILMIALLVIPAAAARFWTETMWKMVVISAILGAGGSMVGAAASAIFANLPSGAMIVLVCAGFFGISMVFGPARGILLRVLRRVELSRTVDRQHLLRAIFEILDVTGQGTAGQNTAGMRAADRVNEAIPIQSLLSKRSWSPWRLNRAIARARHADLVTTSEEDVRMTPAGLDEAARLTRQHRLWELYLINYAEIAPSRVDQDADAIEHVLEPQVISRLESLLESSAAEIPDSPHDLTETETSTLAAPQ